jgi:hypothetical protein
LLAAENVRRQDTIPAWPWPRADGDKLGLYKAMAGAGPLSSQEVAKRSGCGERYVREWLNAQVAGG